LNDSGLSVAEFALDDAGGDADKALTTLLYANEQWKVAEKAAAERKAAEDATEAGWAAAELLAKVEQAAKEKKTAMIKDKQAAENAAAKEGKVQAAKLLLRLRGRRLLSLQLRGREVNHD
jgi:hypothetical protein